MLLLNQCWMGYLGLLTALHSDRVCSYFYSYILHQSLLKIERLRMLCEWVCRMLHLWLQDIRQKYLLVVLAHYLRTTVEET